MPNLEQQAVADWLVALRPADDAAWPPAIRALEKTDRARDLLATLGTRLDDLAPQRLLHLRDALLAEPLRSELRTMLAQLGAARALRLLHWLAEADVPGCHKVIAALTQGDDAAARALRASTEAVTRAATVRRMFAPERIAALERACAAVQEEIA